MSPGRLRTITNLDVVGGAPCLDLANTVNSRLTWDHDYLASYDDLVTWSQRIGLVNPRQAARLRRLGEDDPAAAGRALSRAVELRELVYRGLSAIAAGDHPSADDLAALVDAHADAVRNSHLTAGPGGYQESWHVDRSPDALVWPLAHSAARLVVDGPLDQLKKCPGCAWLFLDSSRNRSRRWCSMGTCGSRDKMRRYYRRRTPRPE